MVKENRFFSFNIKQLPEGCRMCVKGEKLVIFVTGICPRSCYFCPVSEKKYQKDVIYANERVVKSDEDLLLEARNMDAKGAGITGGDPLTRLDRTVDYIKLLKDKFGKEFHIHLYTSLNLVTPDSMQKLYDSGLDEIRFHPDIEDDKLWSNLVFASKFDWDIGMEIPLIPKKEEKTRNLISFISDKVGFINLNELEVADNEQSRLVEMGFRVKSELSYAVKGSLEMGLGLIDWVKEEYPELGVHVCTAKLKDGVQLANRIKREAKHVKKPFDTVDEEGMLIRGALYLPELTPGFGYQEKLETIDREKILEQLSGLLEKIITKTKLGKQDILVDIDKPRLILSKKDAKRNKKIFKKLGLTPTIVTQYPTADQLEMDIVFL